MSSEFVRYTPEIEAIDPDIDELLAQIIEFWEKKGRESPKTEGTGRAVRGAHAKSIGLVKAEVEICVKPRRDGGNVRRTLHHQMQTEPTRADSVLQ